MITQLHSSEDTQSARFYSEDSELGDVQPFAVVLTPPSHALSPKVARLDAETAADAAAIRQEEAKTKQKLWRKAKQSADKHRQRQAQTDIKQEAQDNEKTESEKRKNGKRKMIRQKVNRHGNKKSQDSSTVNSLLLLAEMLLKLLRLQLSFVALSGQLYVHKNTENHNHKNFLFTA